LSVTAVTEEVRAVIARIRAEDVDDKPLQRVSCDVLRALLLLKGAAWHTDLVNELRYIWTFRGWGENQIARYFKHVRNALKNLRDKGMLEAQLRRRASLSGIGAIKEELYLLKQPALVRRCFADDHELLRLEISKLGIH